MKKLSIALLLVACLPLVASAQVPQLEKLSVTFGIGVAIPTRAEAFVDNYQLAAYRSLNLEYAISDLISVYGAYDRSVFGAQTGEVDPVIDVTALGGGMMIFFDLGTSGKLRGYGKIGTANNVIKGEAAQWSAPISVGADWTISKQAGLRGEVALRTFQNSDQIESIMPTVLLNLRPGAK